MYLRFTHQSDAIWTAEWSSVCVALFRQNATVEMLDSMRDAERRMARRLKDDKFSILTIVPAFELKPVPDGVRKRSAEMLAEFAPLMHGAATLIGGSGFFPSIVRSLLSGASLMSRKKIPQQTFDQVTPAAQWLTALDGQTPNVRDSTAELIAAVEDMLADAGTQLG